MSVQSATGLVAPSVQKWVIDSDVEKLGNSEDSLKERLRDESLPDSSIELY